jgi:hypothetical protein
VDHAAASSTPATTMAKASKVFHLQPANLRLVAHLKT